MIYCVEDERNIRELLVYTLETTGFEAIGIQEGKELFRCLEKELPGFDSAGYYASGSGRIQHS